MARGGGQLRITEMYAYVVIDADGNEGVPAVYDRNTRMMMPMTGADTARAESLRPIAEDMARELGRPITLIRFTLRETVEVIEP